MKRFLLQALALICASVSVCAQPALRPLPLDKANVLPLALDDAFQFRKTMIKHVDERENKTTLQHPGLIFERNRVMFGAVNSHERLQRYGHYYTFFWRSDRKTNLTVRFEYRQQSLGSFVQAQEIHYDNAKGSYRTEFKVTGDNYLNDGRVTSWRAILVENGRIVGLNQSYLWN